MVEIEEMDEAQKFEAMFLTRHKAMNEATERGDSAVQQFYCDAKVFVTGGSGFLGKQLIEKLLRATKISKIFVLMRSKKGKPIQQRLNEMLEDTIFGMVKEKHPKFAEKIVAVEGDVAELRLGLSDKDWKTITEEVNIIYHMAATTRFDEALRVATLINVRGTREALMLGKECKKLISYVHVSTAYAHACENLIRTEVFEDFYKSPIEPESLIRLVETVDDERLNAITPSLIKNWPNTYSFGKAVSEEIVNTFDADLPICVVRPAIVIAAFREPNPGWVDISNVYGASGLILGPGVGLMHTHFANYSIHLGLVPVDYVNNAIIAAGWETAKRRAAGDTSKKIYTVTTSTRNPVDWGTLAELTCGIVRDKYATPAAVAYGFVWPTSNAVLFWLYNWILHFIPAYIIDGVCLILGKERRFVKLYTKMYKMSCALSYFTVNDWQFVDQNTAQLYDSLSSTDKEIFDFDVNKINWTEYHIMWCLGIRKYIVKDGLKGSKKGYKKQEVFKYLTIFVIVPLYFYLLYKILSFGILFLSLFVKLFW